MVVLVDYNNFLQRHFSALFKTKKNLSHVHYITLDDYKSELKSVEDELSSVEETINYYVNRRKLLNNWKFELELCVAKFGEANKCCNCKHFNNLHCSKFDSTVDGDATCSSFDWRDYGELDY